MTTAPSRAEQRQALREYVRWSLYPSGPVLIPPRTLTLLVLVAGGVEEEDVYGSRPGEGDVVTDVDGKPLRPLVEWRGEQVRATGSSGDVVSAQARTAGPWRNYLGTELKERVLKKEYEWQTVRDLADSLGPRDRQVLQDFSHRSLKEAALAHHCSTWVIRMATREALDRLLDLLLARVSHRAA